MTDRPKGHKTESARLRKKDAQDESYRQSAIHLWKVLRDEAVPAVVFASATRGEGSTTLAVATAREFRDALGLRPLLIRLQDRMASTNGRTEDDLHDSQDLIAMSNGKDLAGCVQAGEYDLPMIVRTIDAHRSYLTARLQMAIARVLRELQPAYDVVIIDAPALSESTDTMAVCEIIPQIVLVVAARKVRYEVLERATRDLDEHGVKILGTIFNKQSPIIPNWFYNIFLQ